MKQSALFIKNKFGDFLEFFKRKATKKKKFISVEDLKNQIISGGYEEKLKILLEEDLLNHYDKFTVEKALEDFSFIIYENLFREEYREEELQKKELDPLNIRSDEPKRNFILDGEKKNELHKIEKRIPKWLRNPHQINSRILIAYMKLLGDGKSVPYYKLEASCRSIKTFQNNYNQMKSFGERNHAKVFEEAGLLITLWEPSREFVTKEYEKFKLRSN